METFLKAKFQQTLELADLTYKKEASEEKPYEFKYESREMLGKLLQDEFFTPNADDSELTQYQNVCRAILYFHLGVNHADTEENHQAISYFNQSLQLFTTFADERIIHFYNYLQELYNILGLTHLNQDKNEVGLQLLGKSKDLYQSLQTTKYPVQYIVFSSHQYQEKLIQQEFSYQFRYYYTGGVCARKTEELYTLTLFYLAQAYVKLDHRELGAHYSGLTMQRQFETKTYELKDFCVNCISLSEYYYGCRNFRQAQYLILAAQEIIPADRKKRKLRATLQMSLGRMLMEYMKISVRVISEEQQESEAQSLDQLYNKMIIKFQGLNLEIPPVKVCQTVDDVKSIFRQANTQFKLALQYFVLDGFVTEHLQICQDINQMYKQIALLETNLPRVEAMLEKRLTLLQPIFKEINPKAYMSYYQELLVRIGEIYNGLMEVKFAQFNQNPKLKNSKQFADEMNSYCQKTIDFYQQILTTLQEDKESEKNSAYHHSIINALFTIAKAASKLYFKDKEQQIAYLKKSLNTYEQAKDYIKKDVKKVGAVEFEFQQELQICEEMIQMLPTKISQINLQDK